MIDISPDLKGISVLKKLLPYLTKYGNYIMVVIVTMIIGTGISVSIGIGIRFIIDNIPAESNEAVSFLDTTLIIAITVIFIYGVIRYLRLYYIQKVSTKVTEDIRCDIFNNLVNQDIEYIDTQPSGDIQTRIVADTRALGDFLASQIPVIVTSLFILFGGLIGAFYISPKMTIIVLSGISFMIIPFLLVSNKLRNLGESIQSAIAELGRFTGEILRNIRVVKAFNKESYEEIRFSSLAANVAKYTLRSGQLQIALVALATSIFLSGFMILIWLAAKDIIAGSMTIGQLVSFGYFAFLIVQAVSGIVSIIASINTVIGTAQKVTQYLHLERHPWPSTVHNFQCRGAIKFRNVHFSYPNRPDIAVLKGINLEIKAGTCVALVGRSGAGKSTIFELLMRFYDPQSGTIFIDGTDQKNLDIKQLRSFIGLVPQKESLISGSVFDNISYGTDNADESSVNRVAKMAHLDSFIQLLPHGYSTDLGEIGNRLSGGEKQRISIARSLIRKPQILLLDEATSALDKKSEQSVTEGIKHWVDSQGTTVLIIAHRLSTARQADLIIVMDNGIIVGQGGHEELLENCAVYHELYLKGSHELAPIY